MIVSSKNKLGTTIFITSFIGKLGLILNFLVSIVETVSHDLIRKSVVISKIIGKGKVGES